MSSVFFSEHFYEDASKSLEDAPARLETLESGRRWVAYCPVKPRDAQGHASGVIYMFVGRLTTESASGMAHYAIGYDVMVSDGKLAEGSDVWMGAFTNSLVVNPPLPNQIPYSEWFDSKPIPPITGENSKDPTLLGVDEYVRKGLIPPPAAEEAPPPAEDKPESSVPPSNAPPSNAPPSSVPQSGAPRAKRQTVTSRAQRQNSSRCARKLSSTGPLNATRPRSRKMARVASRRTSATLWLT